MAKTAGMAAEKRRRKILIYIPMAILAVIFMAIARYM